ncbi:sensor histidine kinase [Cellulomonas sp. 179-A 4D5 NHS]|uniref:sensor histidine kinase n=1 Tax=Cellulomonas sp. 179-A 4D5 NHS TaxID=3142378 RepID=UPI0039A35F56
MSAPQRDFAHQVVSAGLLVRLIAIMVAMIGMVGDTMTGPVLACVLVLSVSSFSFLVYPQVSGFVVRHPLVVVLDVLLTLTVVALLGVESPLVLATFSTALILGVLFRPQIAWLGAVVLVAGYLAVARATVGLDVGFMLSLGVPALYLAFVAIGLAVRGAHEQFVGVAREAAVAREAVAAADERARLAREMHDSLGKTLHGISLAAQALPLWVERDPAAAMVQARGLADGANQAADEARRLLVRMRADEPDRPLVEVVAELCARWELEHRTECRFTYGAAVDLPPDTRYEVLAILGEALENVARHSGASRVDVELRGQPDGTVRLSVQDDGQGFVPREDGTSPRGHFGLTGMRERALEVGAELGVRSTPGAGTEVVVQVGPTKERSDVPR